MFEGIGFGAERIGLAVLNWPKTAMIFMLALLVLIGASLPHVSFDDDINRVFLSDSALSDAQRAYESQQNPPSTTLLIHIASAELSENFEDIEGVSTVISPFSMVWPAQAEEKFGEVVLEEPLRENFIRDVTAFEAMETGLPSYLSKNRASMIINLVINTDTTKIAKAVDVVKRDLNDTLPASLSANITGEDVISAEIVSGLKDDLISLNIWGALLVSFAAFLLLRDFKMALLAVTPAIIGAAGILALSVWLGYPITVLSNVIPILILVLGVANGLHLAGSSNYLQSLFQKCSPLPALDGPA